MLEVGRNELRGTRTSNEIRKGLQSISEEYCRLSWQLALTLNDPDQTMEREEAFQYFLTCSPESVKLVELFAKEDIRLAQQSVIIYPG